MLHHAALQSSCSILERSGVGINSSTVAAHLHRAVLWGSALQFSGPLWKRVYDFAVLLNFLLIMHEGELSCSRG